jgi:hypothetical protein
MDGLLCHCWPEDATGHDPAECGTKIPTRLPGWPEISRTSDGPYGINWARAKARGTCPVCGENAPVQRIQVFAQYEFGRRLPPVENPKRPRGSVLEIRPGMAPHKVGGVQCDGVGKVPTETRYTPGRELASYLQVLAEENAEEKTA